MKITPVLLILLTFCSTTALYANNYSFMNDSAISHFNNKDTAMMAANFKHALNHTADGKKSSWRNPNTHAWGYAIPSNTIRRNGTICRNLKIVNEADKIPGESNYIFCKMNGEWKTQ